MVDLVVNKEKFPFKLEYINNKIFGNVSIYKYNSDISRIYLDPSDISDNDKKEYSRIDIGGNDALGILTLRNTAGYQNFFADGNGNIYMGGAGGWGRIGLRDDKGNENLSVSGGGLLNVGGQKSQGEIYIRSPNGADTIHISGGGYARIGGTGKSGIVVLKNENLRDSIKLDAGMGAIEVGAYGVNGSRISIKDLYGETKVTLGGDGKITLGGKGDKNGSDGEIILKDKEGNEKITIRGDTGDIELSGADCAEEFEIDETFEIDCGTVLVIGENGKLRLSDRPFDKRVVGVVSGARGFKPGLILDKKSCSSGRMPVALTGKTYCKVDARNSPIDIGDLLTTSWTPGHAMKVNEPSIAFGSVIGKALASLRDGTGMIPILVALQ